MLNKVQFNINVKGETSEETFEGLFELKTKLSIKDQLREDEIRRSILGGMPEGASTFAHSLADALSYIAVRIVKAPDWWVKNNGGLDLEDLNVISKVHTKAIECITAELKKREEDAEKARGELKKASEALHQG